VRAAAALALLAAGCLEVAEDRARGEEEIGHARSEVAEVRVEDGLGSVQRLDGEGLALWGSAPSLTIHLTFAAGAPARFTLAIDNALPDAVLSGLPGAVPSDGAVATEKRWSFAPPAAGGELVFTVAPPDAVMPGTFRFAVLADVQEAIGRVQDVYARINDDPRIRFLVFDGDLTTLGSVAQLQRFQRECKSLRVPIFATLGNHELGSPGLPFHALFGRGSFRYLFRGVQFTMLDSASATIAPTTYTRLQGWLDEGQSRLHVVGMHIPPIDPVGTRNGAFASRAEGARLLAMLARGGVDLTLYGHIHSYYSFWNAGMPAFISGGGGAIPERFDGIGRHFLVIDADPAAGVFQTHVVRVD
jgi:3',5'-cyclic-AMP phosphodiesterase